MIRKCLVLVAVSLFAGSVALAEPQRAFFVKENRLPGPYKVEIGAVGQYVQVPDENVISGDGQDEYTAVPYIRYGLGEMVALELDVPYTEISPSHGDSERGLGDVVAGAEFLVFQDLFGYPFIVPHVEVSFDTGDEDKGLGNGDTLLTAGVSVGTVVMDMFHYIVDARCTFNKTANDGSGDEKNIGTFAGAFIWDLNEKFSLIAEGKVSSDKNAEDDIPMYAQGGFGLQATENVYITILGGGAKNTAEDVLVSGKLSYSF